MNAEYEKALLKLAARVRQADETRWSPTESKKECERVAKALEDMADLLAESPESMRIEAVHAQRGEPEEITGLDGWPQKVPSDYEWPSYESLKWEIRDLATSARLAADTLPDPREKHALRHAAIGVLHLRNWHDLLPATAYIDGEAAKDLGSVANLAGIILSKESYLKALKEAIDKFDPNFRPSELSYLFKYVRIKPFFTHSQVSTNKNAISIKSFSRGFGIRLNL